MSRLAHSKASPVATKRDGRMGATGAQDGELLHYALDSLRLTDAAAEVCPVCKSSRYMNPSLRFLVNPECYHKMCESCVDRIFSHGPAQCPIPGCTRTLRKHRFREQTFEDIRVEREVDIRKRVAAVFNKREEEFEQLRDYNDYLNEVEDITFNLVNGIDLAETNRRFEEYERAHAAEIKENERLAKQEKMSFSQKQKAERQLARERREAARREEEAERRELEEGRRDLVNRLASGQDPDKVERQGQVQLKKRLDRQAAATRQQELRAADEAARNGAPLIKGLKARPTKSKEPEKPVDPFGGIRIESKYFSLQEEYLWSGVQETKKDARHMAGGYDVRDYTQRSLVAAFSGFSVFVSEEVDQRERGRVDDREVATMRADVGLKDSGMADAPR
ncbi:RNA polymerase II transcription factor B subunit 3-like [Teratosphaeria destructans]|uniref:RNA polymerase II transcription factor B subunit 3 n=1 Tax=Teratosphaeria destructans TaxID=418781 RepID=A0A9W7SLD8_9PEZI|nr:RNA polymerase II transcription factor B subunit 3-like [Teratosphaeria destructans]